LQRGGLADVIFMRIIHAGAFSTVQDLGRRGFASLGVPCGGAADTVSLRLGNRLVGNPDGTPAIEMTLTGGVFEFEDSVVVALAGARTHAVIQGAGDVTRPCREWAAEVVRRGERLRVGAMERGSRTYLCIGGGVRVPTLMRSGSTLVSAGFGGVEGRVLRAGDRVELGPAPEPMRAVVLGEEGAALVHSIVERRTIRAVAGAHSDAFDPDAGAAFWNHAFAVTSQFDRAGLRLEGPTVGSPHGGRMPSEGMMWGAVQVPADGRPIVLMADHPTTGGYPVLACVVSADLPTLGQLRARDVVRFERVTLEQSWALLREQERHLEAAIVSV